MKIFTTLFLSLTMFWSSIAYTLTTAECVSALRDKYNIIREIAGVSSSGRGTSTAYGDNRLTAQEQIHQEALMRDIAGITDLAFQKFSRAFLHMRDAISSTSGDERLPALEAHLREQLGSDIPSDRIQAIKNVFAYIDQNGSTTDFTRLGRSPNVVNALEAIYAYTQTEEPAFRISRDEVYLMRHIQRHAQDTFCRDTQTTSSTALRYSPSSTRGTLGNSGYYNQMLTEMHDSFSQRDFRGDLTATSEAITARGERLSQLRDYENSRYRAVLDAVNDMRDFFQNSDNGCNTNAVKQALMRFEDQGGLHFRVNQRDQSTNNRCNLAHFIRSITTTTATDPIEPIIHFMNANYMTRTTLGDTWLRRPPQAVFAHVEAGSVACELDSANNQISVTIDPIRYLPRAGWKTVSGNNLSLRDLTSDPTIRPENLTNPEEQESFTFNHNYRFTGETPPNRIFIYDSENTQNNISIIFADGTCRVEDVPEPDVVEDPIDVPEPLSLMLNYKNDEISGPNEELVALFKKGAHNAEASDLSGDMTWSWACEESEVAEGITRDDGNCSATSSATPSSERSFPRRSEGYPVTVTSGDLTQEKMIRPLAPVTTEINYTLSISPTNTETTYRLTAVVARTPTIESITGNYVWSCTRATPEEPETARDRAGAEVADAVERARDAATEVAPTEPAAEPAAEPEAPAEPTEAPANLCTTTSDPKVATVEQQDFAILAKVTFTPSDMPDSPKEATYTVAAKNSENPNCDLTGDCEDDDDDDDPEEELPPPNPSSTPSAGGRPPTFTPTQLPPPPGFNIKYGTY